VPPLARLVLGASAAASCPAAPAQQHIDQNTRQQAEALAAALLNQPCPSPYAQTPTCGGVRACGVLATRGWQLLAGPQAAGGQAHCCNLVADGGFACSVHNCKDVFSERTLRQAAPCRAAPGPPAAELRGLAVPS
jgi:hypothetical protein